MAVIQEAFEIPEDLLAKILTGEYKRCGGVVRYAVGPNKGQIVKHLKPTAIEEVKENTHILGKVVEFVGAHKKGCLLAGVFTIVATVGGATYIVLRNNEPKVVKEFRANLKLYLNAIQEGRLSIDEINGLSSALKDLKEHKDYEKHKIKLTSEELGVLVSTIFKYTENLAELNNYTMDGLEETNNRTADSVIINLEDYLNRQKEWFKVA